MQVCSLSHSTNLIGGSYYTYIWELPIFVTLGAVSGCAGAVFVACNIRLRHARRRLMPWDTPWQHLRAVEVSKLRKESI